MLYDARSPTPLPFFPKLQKLDIKRNNIPPDQLRALKRKYPFARIVG
jgi:hypothetical protein